MSDEVSKVVRIEDYLAKKVNDLAQRYRKLMGTCMEHCLKEELRAEGERHARYMTFLKRKERDGAIK